MDIKEIKKIIQLMKEHDLAEFEMEDQGVRIAIKRRDGEPRVVMAAAPVPAVAVPPVAAPAPAPAAAASAPASTAEAEANWVMVKSPIVGTFYRAPAPDAEPFVTVGQEVEEDTVLCIIEAMKVMNEIKAEVHGIVRKILVENATPVEFDQPLFQIEPIGRG